MVLQVTKVQMWPLAQMDHSYTTSVQTNMQLQQKTERTTPNVIADRSSAHRRTLTAMYASWVLQCSWCHVAGPELPCMRIHCQEACPCLQSVETP